ncbi:MAG: NAD(P)H-binding protein [Chloroflexi bacterium]|nr:NAD(P)H-binding protein [Chloroflexota bacterium]
MKVFIAGATGVLGRSLVPLLLQQGHTVRALVRSPERVPVAVGVELSQGDLLAEETKERLPALMSGCQAVLHIATAIPRDFGAPGAWDANTRLRIEGTRSLLDASLVAGVERYVQQSITLAYEDGGDRWLDESTPFDTSPARARTSGPVIEMERMVRAVPLDRLAWCILRGGSFVGRGTAQESVIQRLHEGVERVSCDGRNYISPVNVADMAEAIVASLQRAPGGSIFNIVDEPLRQGDYLDRLAALVGAPLPPRNLGAACPASLRCSNEAARRVLGWSPNHGIWPEVREHGPAVGRVGTA